MQTVIGNLAGVRPATLFESHLRENADRYFVELKGRPINVRLLAEQSRTTSIFFRYRIGAGELRYSVLIKTPASYPVEQLITNANERLERPRLAATPDPRTRQHLEYTTLSAIQRHFEPLQDPRFGFIRPLDFLPDHAALVMEEAHRPNLRQLFAKKNRLQLPFDSTDLQQAFRNAGAWLQHYQALPRKSDVQVRQPTREAFTESIAHYTSYLEKALDEASFFREVGKTTTRLARAVLPVELPMGLGHGDYAMRNILVGNGGSTTVIDTLGRWRVPVYEDIAYFLVRLKAIGPQVFTLGWAYSATQIAAYEEQFLSGYFDKEEVPLAAIRLFEVQALLDSWSAHAARYSQAKDRGQVSLMRRIRFALTSRFFRMLLCTLVDCKTLA